MTTPPPADSEAAPLDPPPHLRGALRAAAAARARTARIRARSWSHEPAGELSAEAGDRLPPPPMLLEAAEAPPGAPCATRDPRQAFARTVAAASQARSAVPADGADAPWHLQLRHQRAEASERRSRWLSRLVGGLSTKRKPARAVVPADPEAAGGGGQSRSRSAGAAMAPGQYPRSLAGPPETPCARQHASARPPLALDWRPEPAPESGASPTVRWARPDEDRAWAGWVGESRVAGVAGHSAPAARWRPHPTGAGDLDPGPARAASAPSGRGGEDRAAPPWARRLPATTGAGGLPAPRLADLLATSLPALADRGRAGSGAANGAPPSRAAARLRPRRARSAARLIAVVGAIIGGFGLGIVANGGALLTGSKLGEAMLALDLGLFNRTQGAPLAARAPEPASRPPVATPQEQPAVPASTPGPAAAGKAAAASQAELAEAKGAGAAVQPSAPEHGRVASARGEPAAAPVATATGWEALYAEGHRFQLRGNLVAAADAYRRAIRLNPHHPAILYDLGYVLQMQGRSDAAMDHYRRTIALEPDHAYAHYNLGYLLQERGESTAAGRHYEIAAGRLPGNPYIYYDWAWSLESAGDLAGAAALYRKTIEIDPDRRPGLDARRRLAALGVPARPE